MKLSEWLLELALLLVLFPFGCFVLGNLGFLLGLSLTKWYAILAFLMTLGVLKFWTKTWREFMLKALFFSVVQLGFMTVGALHTDNSWDARMYHKPAAMLMAEGWNPIWTPDVTKFCEEKGISAESFRVSHLCFFPKGQWVVCGVLYLATGNFDAGDYVDYVYLFVLAVVIYCVLRELLGTEKWLAALAAGMVSLNPISIMCLPNGQIDGLLAATFLIFLLASACFLKNGLKRWIPWILLPAVFGCTLKHTAPVYFGLAGFVLTLPLIWRAVFHSTKFEGIGLKSWLKVMLPIPFMVLILSANPYITNTLTHTSPFYPLHSFDRKNHPVENILDGWYENPDFRDASPLQRFVYSYFISRPEELLEKTETDFQISKIGTLNFKDGFLPLGVYGWIFGLALLVSLAGLAFLKYREEASSIVIWMLLALIVTVVIQPHAWWARFVPQIWAFPALVLTALTVSWRDCVPLARRWKIATALFLGALLFQGLACFVYTNGRMICYLQLEQQMFQLAEQNPPTFLSGCSLVKEQPNKLRSYEWFDCFTARMIQDGNLPESGVLPRHYGWRPIPGKLLAYHEGTLLISAKEPLEPYDLEKVELGKEDVSMKKVFPSICWKLKLRVSQMMKANGIRS